MFVLAKIFACIVGRVLSHKSGLYGADNGSRTLVAHFYCLRDKKKKGKDTDFCCGFFSVVVLRVVRGHTFRRLIVKILYVDNGTCRA